MSPATQAKKPPLQPPPEKNWQRYSPNHELPLAGMTSLFMHGFILGVVGLGWLLYFVQRDSDNSKPPSQDVVMITGEGDGLGGMGAEPGLPGEEGPKLTELTPQPEAVPFELTPTENFKEAPKVELSVPETPLPETKTDVESVLSKLEKEANDQAKKLPAKKAARIAMSGTGNPKGQGGRGGTGGGLGMSNQGMGPGAVGVGGRLATKAQIYAMRWRFNLAGNAKQHVEQLKAIGLVVVFHAPNSIDYFVKDLSRRPAALSPGNINQYRDAVQWHNESPQSILDLAKELRLTFVPTAIYLYVPKEREETIAAEEARFSKAVSNNANNIKETKFIFRLVNGKYEPEAIEQTGFDGRILKKF
jgi:hypothetical protein